MTSSWVLRPFTAADTASIREAFTDPAIAQWSLGSLVGDDVVDWWTKRNNTSDPTHWSRAISTADGTLLGHVSLLHLNHVQQCGDIGYMVLPASRRQGVARWAVTTAFAQAFGPLDLRRLQLYHGVENAGSCGVARSCGFALEGTLRQSYRYGDGVWHDEHVHARLASDPA